MLFMLLERFLGVQRCSLKSSPQWIVLLFRLDCNFYKQAHEVTLRRVCRQSLKCLQNKQITYIGFVASLHLFECISSPRQPKQQLYFVVCWSADIFGMVSVWFWRYSGCYVSSFRFRWKNFNPWCIQLQSQLFSYSPQLKWTQCMLPYTRIYL